MTKDARKQQAIESLMIEVNKLDANTIIVLRDVAYDLNEAKESVLNDIQEKLRSFCELDSIP